MKSPWNQPQWHLLRSRKPMARAAATARFSTGGAHSLASFSNTTWQWGVQQKWRKMVDFMGFNHQELPKWGVQLVNSALDFPWLPWACYGTRDLCKHDSTMATGKPGKSIQIPMFDTSGTLDTKHSSKCKPKNHPIFTNHSPFFATQQKSVAYLSIIFHIFCNWLPPFLGSNPFL
jgi:hypothetical protein